MATDFANPFSARSGLEARFRQLVENWARFTQEEHETAEFIAATDQFFARSEEPLSSLEATIDRLVSEAEDPAVAREVKTIWPMTCIFVGVLLGSRDSLGAAFPDPSVSRLHRGFQQHLERATEMLRVMAVTWPNLNLVIPDNIREVVLTVHISPWAYLRAMVNLFWSAIRHPLSETTIDLSSGRVLYRT